MTHVSGRDSGSGSPPPHIHFADPADELAVSRRRPVVLLVDDIEDCRDVYGQFLRHTGYEVVEASDGHEALAKARALAPDIVVMDLWMPHLDGWESIRRLKASPATAKIPVLVLTGDAYAQARHDAEAAGCQAYMVKPCLPMDVAAEVGRLVMAARAGGTDAAPVQVMSPRRGGGRRQAETAGGLLSSVVAEADRRFEELSRHLSAVEVEVETLPADSRRALEERMAQAQEASAALRRHVDALKVIARSADVKITIPARRGTRKP